MHTKKYPVPGVYPFWFWNGEQTESEIERQMNLFAQSGCRGVLIHSRYGNRIPYLSERWLELVRYTCETAKSLDMKIWIYDEDGYPSGNAGGQVQKLRPDLIQKNMAYEYGKTNPEKPSFAAFDPANGFMRIDETKVPAGTDALLFNVIQHTSHVDTFHPDSVRLFLKLTHEKYAQSLSGYFGNVIEAVYTDDESFECCLVNAIAWSDILAAEYKKRFDRDLTADLPYLTEDLDGAEDIRLKYYKTASELFLKNFIIPQREWCNDHGLLYTGHLCCDEGPLSVLIKAFYEPMQYQKTEDIPAIDDFLTDIRDLRYLSHPFNMGCSWLTQTVSKRAPLLLYKPGSSVAHQFAGNNFSAELLTCTSWGTDTEFINGQMLFELGMGITHLTPHAFYYTLGRNTRNDCPPAYSYQQPFFAQEGQLIRSWTNIAQRLASGKFLADVMVIYPAGTACLENGTAASADFKQRFSRLDGAADEFEKQYANLLLSLSRKHVGYDLGCEAHLKEFGEARDGCIVLGDMSYHTVILPPCIDIQPETAELLQEFKRQGGKVLTNHELNELVPELNVSGEHTEEILIHSRFVSSGKREHYLVNLSGRNLNPVFDVNGKFTLSDAETGEVFFYGEKTPECFVFPKASALFLTETETVPHIPEQAFRNSRFYRFTEKNIARFVSLEPMRDNTLVLDGNQQSGGFVLGNGADVKCVYGENLDSAEISVNGIPLAYDSNASPHPQDPCFQCIRIPENVLKPEECNRILIEPRPDFLYVEGRFRVNEKYLQPMENDLLQPGDLSAQGYAGYWGSFMYHFEFCGIFHRARLNVIRGAAEVFVNGRKCGTTVASPYLVSIGNACNSEKNTMQIIFSGTVENFITGSKHPYGLFSVELD